MVVVVCREALRDIHAERAGHAVSAARAGDFDFFGVFLLYGRNYGEFLFGHGARQRLGCRGAILFNLLNTVHSGEYDGNLGAVQYPAK